MSPKIILVEHGDGVIELRLNRPEVHNAIDPEMAQNICDELVRGKLTNAKSIILSGEGSSFCSGADQNWFKARALEHQNNGRPYQLRDELLTLSNLYYLLNKQTCPKIGVAHGSVYGGGIGLLCCCDLVYAAPHTIFYLSELSIGLVPAIISPYLKHKLGEQVARKLALTSDFFNARHAGLVDLQLYDLDQARTLAIKKGRELGGNDAFAQTKLIFGGKCDDGSFLDRDQRCGLLEASIMAKDWSK